MGENETKVHSNSSSDNNSRTNDSGEYSVGLHKFCIAVQMLVVVTLCLVAIPWGLREILIGFDKWDGFNYYSEQVSGENQNEENESANEIPVLDMLANFLGGFAGLLIGFFFEFTYIEQWKHLNKYSALCATLARELLTIKEALEKNPEDLGKINLWGIDDVTSSVENDSIIINLPLLFTVPFLKKNRIKSGKDFGYKLSQYIHELHGHIRQYNGQKYIQTSDKKTSDKNVITDVNTDKTGETVTSKDIIKDIDTILGNMGF